MSVVAVETISCSTGRLAIRYSRHYCRQRNFDEMLMFHASYVFFGMNDFKDLGLPSKQGSCGPVVASQRIDLNKNVVPSNMVPILWVFLQTLKALGL